MLQIRKNLELAGLPQAALFSSALVKLLCCNCISVTISIYDDPDRIYKQHQKITNNGSILQS